MSITNEQYKVQHVAVAVADRISESSILLAFACRSEGIKAEDRQTYDDLQEAAERLAQASMRIKAIIRRLEKAERGKP